MRFEITGLDALQRHLTEAKRAFEALDGKIGAVTIDGSDPASIETAIAHMEQAVDERIQPYQRNALVAKVGADLKERYAAAIRQRGEEALADFEHRSSAEPEHSEEETTFMNTTPENQAAPTAKDAQRYLVLDYFYQYNEQHCADEQWSEHAASDLQQQAPTITHGDVARAMAYLSDKGLLRVTQRQAYISGEETVVRGSITARGIDAIERPNDFRGVLSAQIINYIVHGSMNVAHGDQQVVGRDNSGNLAQGQARLEHRNEMPALPAEQLRQDFADHPGAVSAIDTLEAELRTETPRASVVAAAIEAIKNVANIAEIGRTFTGWFTDPSVQHQLAAIALSTFRI